eukprot:2415382-Pleurochrysis_carterae.AAC.1
MAAIPVSLAANLGFPPMFVRPMRLHLYQNCSRRFPVNHHWVLRRRPVHPLLRQLVRLFVLLIHYRPGFAMERRGRRP